MGVHEGMFDMFMFIDSKMQPECTQRCTGGRAPGSGETCVFKAHTGLIMLI